MEEPKEVGEQPTTSKTTKKASTTQKSKAKIIETTKKSKTKTTKSDTDGPPKRKRCQAKTVIARLEKMGVSAGRVGSCVKSAMGKGIIVLTGDKSDLEQVVIEGDYEGHDFKVLLKDVLYQEDYGGDYGDGSEGATAICTCCGPDDYPMRAYVTRLCQGNPQFDCGKFHNHCTECKGFGICIGDYRESHCEVCNKHWFEGNYGFPCDNCQQKKLRERMQRAMAAGDLRGMYHIFQDDSEEDSEDSERDQGDCVTM